MESKVYLFGVEIPQEESTTPLIIDSAILKGGQWYLSYKGEHLLILEGYDKEAITFDSGFDPSEVTPDVESNHISALIFVQMSQNGDLDDVTISEHPTLFSNWTQNWTGKAGTILKDEGALYKSIHDVGPGQNTKPSTTPSMWTRIGNPDDEWPEWIQPIGAHDAYLADAKVSHKNKHWLNIHGNGNVWEPGVFGWEEQL